MSISSISSSAITTSQAVSKSGVIKNSSEDTESTTSLLASEDSVEISDEAYSLLQSTHASSETASTESNSTDDSATDSASADETVADDESAVSESASSTTSTEDSTDDDIDDLEEEISTVQREIRSLTAKAVTDETAESALAAKESEKMALNVELVQLQTE